MMVKSPHIPPRPELATLQHQARWLVLLLIAIGIHSFEAALPSLGPWFKPGLANIITLIALVMFGAKAAFSLAIARIIVSSLLIGTLFTPTFIIALTSTIAATSVMILAWKYIPNLHLIGISLLGAVTHMSVQVFTVETLFIQQDAIYFVLPPLLLLSCFTGWFNGALAEYVRIKLGLGKS